MPRTFTAEFTLQDLAIDVAPFNAPAGAWTAMQNMQVSGDGVERAPGQIEFAPGYLHAPKFCMTCILNSEVWLLYAGATGVGVTNGVSHYDVTPTSGWTDFLAGTMTGALMNGVPCFNAPNRPPWYWNGTLAVGGVKPMPGWLTGAPVARTFASFNAHCFAGSISGSTIDYGRLAWSDAAPVGTIPATWVPTATNQAGELQLSTGGGNIQAMRGLGPNLMVYRTTGCWAVSYVGRPYIYIARKLAAEVGAATQNSVADVRGSHAILAPGDIVLTDGTSLRSIGEGRVKRWLFSQISEQGMRLSHAYATPGRAEVAFCVALGQDEYCNFAYCWNYERDKWSVRELPKVTHSISTYIPAVIGQSTWDTDAGEWETDFKAWDASAQSGFVPRALGVSPEADTAYLLEAGDLSASGQPVSASVERTGLVVGDAESIKVVRRMRPRVSATPGTVLTVQVGAQVGPGDSVLWEQPQSFEVGRSRAVDCFSVGRYFGVRFSAAVATPWSVGGFGLDGEVRGRV
jgi:hypothetical protein